MVSTDPDGLGINAVYCDMTLDDGGWTLVFINNVDGTMLSKIEDSMEILQITISIGWNFKYPDAYMVIRSTDNQLVSESHPTTFPTDTLSPRL